MTAENFKFTLNEFVRFITSVNPENVEEFITKKRRTVATKACQVNQVILTSSEKRKDERIESPETNIHTLYNEFFDSVASNDYMSFDNEDEITKKKGIDASSKSSKRDSVNVCKKVEIEGVSDTNMNDIPPITTRKPSYTLNALSQSSKGDSMKVDKKVDLEGVSDTDFSDGDISKWKPNSYTTTKQKRLRVDEDSKDDNEETGTVIESVIHDLSPQKKSGRKIRRIWSKEEENILIEAHKKHAKANYLWSDILKDPEYKTAFKGRTAVNLKDKYRNIFSGIDKK
jgi:hypothetical protein